MTHRHSVASLQIVWQKKIPETLLDLYFNHVRMLPSWKVSFPNYVHAAILDAVELEGNETKITTAAGEYVFMFSERSTFVPEAAEFVKTGILEVHFNQALVLCLTISPPDSDGVGPSWVARSIEEFKEGEWIAELTQLDSQLLAYEGEQTKKEEALRRDELRVVDEIKEKLAKLPSLEAKEVSWFRRLFR
jgi:hypothetical protein